MTNAIPILTFHDISNDPSSISFSPEIFRKGLTGLHQRGYRTIALAEAVHLLRTGGQLQKNHFVITFDDGYASVYNNAFPVLFDLGMTATVFFTVDSTKTNIPVGKISDFGRLRMLEWQHAQEMNRYGISFGGHTLSHRDLTQLSLDEAQKEITLCKTILEENLGNKIVSFAYPLGSHNYSIRKIVEENFLYACSDKLGYATPISDLLAIERIDAYYFRTKELFDMAFSPMFPLYIRIRGILRTTRRILANRNRTL